MPDPSSLPQTTPHPSTASLVLYPPDSPHENDSYPDSSDEHPSPLSRPRDPDADHDLDLEDPDTYDLLSPSDLDSPSSHNASHHPPTKPDPSLPPFLLIPSTLTPALSLGALLLPHTLAPLPPLAAFGLVPLVVALSASAQSINRAVGRYVRRESVEERVAEALVGSGRGVRRERWKKRVGRGVWGGMVGTGVGLTVVYLRSAVLLLSPLLEPYTSSPAIPPLLALSLSLSLLPVLLLTPAQRYIPLLHLFIYALLLSTSLYALFHSSTSPIQSSSASSSPLPLPTLNTILHQPRQDLTPTLFFQSLSLLALLPISLSPPSQPPTRPLLRSTPHILSPLLTLPLVLLPPTWPSSHPFAPLAPVLSCLLLLLSAARVVRGVLRPRVTTTRARAAFYAGATALLLLSVSLPEAWGVGELLWDAVLASLIWHGYVLPALTHVILHHLRAPLAILFPATPGGDGTHDMLLLKKERMMQAKRETKRVLHDLVVFAALLPGGMVVWGWCLGRVVRLW